MEKKLYPMMFLPIGCRRPWGGTKLAENFGKTFTELSEEGYEVEMDKKAIVGESWELADMGEEDSPILNGFLAGNTISDVMETYMERLVGEKVFERYGTQFPLLIKFLDVQGKLSVQIHPNDEDAAQRYDSLGKEEVWYILDAEEDARVYVGFKEDTDPTEFYYACKNGTADRMLNVIKPKKGDVILIKPGTVHSAEGGVLICEIQESSDITLRLYDWGRENDPATARPTHLEEAFDLINFKKFNPEDYTPAPRKSSKRETETVCFADCPQFTTSHIRLFDGMHIYTDQLESFVIYTCISGEVSLQMADENGVTKDYRLHLGESILVPAECPDFILSPIELGSELIEALVHPSEEADSYVPDGEFEDCDDDCDDDCECGGHHHSHDCNCGHEHGHDCGCGGHHHHHS